MNTSTQLLQCDGKECELPESCMPLNAELVGPRVSEEDQLSAPEVENVESGTMFARLLGCLSVCQPACLLS